MMLVPNNNDLDLLDSMLENPFFRKEGKLMKTDIKEHKNKYVLRMDLPGYKKEDIKISVANGYLLVEASASKEKDKKEDDGKYIKQERYYGECSRSFYIGDNIEAEDIKAHFHHGVLKLDIPKNDELDPSEKTSYVVIEEDD